MRGGGGNIVAAIGVVLVAAFLIASILAEEAGRREMLRLVRAGGGEVHYLTAHIRCQGSPHLARGMRHGMRTLPISFGTRVEIVARENGWALIDRYGNPCWAPLWALSPNAPDMRAATRCGMACHSRPPPGWREQQRQAACERGWKLRFDCFIDRLTGRDGLLR